MFTISPCSAGLSKATEIARHLFDHKSKNHDAGGNKLEQEALFLQLITLILEYKHTDSDNTEHKINKILKYVQTDCFSDINWHDLSEQFGVPLRTLFRHLKEKTGMTPDNYLKRLRLISARKKIRETDISITNIAFDCGFSNSNHFATAYKSVFGITPSTERTNYSHSA